MFNLFIPLDIQKTNQNTRKQQKFSIIYYQKASDKIYILKRHKKYLFFVTFISLIRIIIITNIFRLFSRFRMISIFWNILCIKLKNYRFLCLFISNHWFIARVEEKRCRRRVGPDLRRHIHTDTDHYIQNQTINTLQLDYIRVIIDSIFRINVCKNVYSFPFSSLSSFSPLNCKQKVVSLPNYCCVSSRKMHFSSHYVIGIWDTIPMKDDKSVSDIYRKTNRNFFFHIISKFFDNNFIIFDF